MRCTARCSFGATYGHFIEQVVKQCVAMQVETLIIVCSDLYERVLNVGAGMDWSDYVTAHPAYLSLDGLAAAALDGKYKLAGGDSFRSRS